MKTFRDTEYHDPEDMGSLSRALQMWLAIRRDGPPAIPYQLVFTICCPGESRANRVAGFLRRRLACGATEVKQAMGDDGANWHVTGVTRLEIQSLRGLERLSAWLRRAATSHQVHLLHVGLVEAAI